MTASQSGGIRRYGALVSSRERRHLVGGGLAARVPVAVSGFSVLFFVSSVTGSFADAGLASGVAIAAGALSGPVFGRIADRRGQRGALLVAAIGHPVAVALLIAAGIANLSLVVLIAAVLLVGLTIVPAGAFSRARWASLLDDDSELHLAFSIEAVADELVWVFGPALASLICATVNPAAGLALSGAVAVFGCLWLRSGAAHRPIAAGRVTKHSFVPWRSRRVMALLLSSIALGVMFGVNDVTVVAWAMDAHVPEIAGLVLTAYSIGSVTGGILMGALPTRVPAYRMLVFAAAALGLSWSALALAPDLQLLFPLGFVAGMTITPVTISTNRVLHEEVRGEVFTEAVAWVSACVAGSAAFGSFIGGLTGQARGGISGFDIVAISAPMVFVIIVAIRFLPRRTRRSEPTYREAEPVEL